MKTLLLFSALLLAPSACAVSAPAETVILRQALVVELDPVQHLLSGECTLALGPGVRGKMTFALNPRATISAVRLADKNLPFEFSAGNLTVTFPAPAASGDATLAVSYRCTYNDPVPERPVTAEGESYEGTGVIAERGAYLGSAAGWYPVPSVFPRKRSVTVITPRGFEAITAGRRTARRLVESGTTTVWEEEHPVERLSLSAGPYVVEERTRGGVSLATYFFADDSRLAPAYLAAMEKYIQRYSEIFGPYPFEKFAVVENFFPTGYGFPSYTLLGNAVVRLPFIIDSSLPHEIAHCWWGNGVLVDYRGGNWSEGLVTYFADHLMEAERSPEGGRDYRYRLLTDYAALVPPDKDFPLRDFTSRSDPASRAIGYGKGAMVFHMVRQIIGDDAFFKALRSVCREKLYHTATWDDFTRAFSRAAGTNLSPFMKQWLSRPGGPHVALAEVRRQRVDGKWRVTGTIEQQKPPYALQVRLRLTTSHGDREENVLATGQRTPFTISSPDEPSRLLLDPEADIFRILSPREVPATVNRVKGAHSFLAVVTSDCRADRETLRLLLSSLGKQGARVVGEDELDPAAASGDLLVCGVPRRPLLLPPPAGISYSSEGFTIAGENFSGDGDALFLVTSLPSAPERVVALFLPRSRGAAAECVPKITHYGRYGYLAFTDGENRKKGVIMPEGGGSVVTFAPGKKP